MACKTKVEMLKELTRAILKDIRSDKTLSAKEKRHKAILAANKILEKAFEQADTKINGVAQHLGKTEEPVEPLKKVEMPRYIQELKQAYENNPSIETKAAWINEEIINGYRNTAGKPLVELMEVKDTGRTVTIDEELSREEAFVYYNDSDGSINKSKRINKAFKDMDKKVQGESARGNEGRTKRTHTGESHNFTTS